MTPPARASLALILGLVAAASAGQALAQNRSADTENRRVRVHNQTGAPVRALSAAEGASGAFGPDLLAATPLEPGQSRPVTVDAGSGACVFTIRAVLSDGTTLSRPGVNVCRLADWYLTR